MGRSYWFECSKCGYRATVSGGADRGLNFFVQTILCRDCKCLHDAVTRLKIPAASASALQQWRYKTRASKQLKTLAPAKPVTFQEALNRLPYNGVRQFRWVRFELSCPVSPLHRVVAWNAPAKCPHCGIFMEQNALPFRIWE